MHQIWVRAGQEVPRPEQWRALQGSPDLLQLEPNLELSGEFQQDLDSRRWSSCLCLGSMYESSRGCVPQIVFQTIILFFIFSLLENSTSSPTGREVQLSSLKAWTTLALVQSSILKRTSTNLPGKELVASPMAPGNSWSPGLPVLKVNFKFNILITDQYSPLSSRQLHISSTWASRTDALGRKSGIWWACQSVQLFHVEGRVLKHYLPLYIYLPYLPFKDQPLSTHADRMDTSDLQAEKSFTGINIKALNRIFLSFDNIDNKVKNLVKIDLSDKIR